MYVLYGSKSNICNLFTLMCSKYDIGRFSDNFNKLNIKQQGVRYWDEHSVQNAAIIRDFIEHRRFNNNVHSLYEMIMGFMCVLMVILYMLEIL